MTLGHLDAGDILGRIKYLYVECNGNIAKLSRRLGVGQSMAKFIMNGQRQPGAKVARALGFRSVTVYVPINKTAGPHNVKPSHQGGPESDHRKPLR